MLRENKEKLISSNGILGMPSSKETMRLLAKFSRKPAIGRIVLIKLKKKAQSC